MPLGLPIRSVSEVVTLPVTLAVPLAVAVSLAWLVGYESRKGPVLVVADPGQSGR